MFAKWADMGRPSMYRCTEKHTPRDQYRTSQVPRCHSFMEDTGCQVPGFIWRLTPKHEPLEAEDQDESMSLTWNSGATEKWQVAGVMCNYILHEYADLVECIQVELKLWIGLCWPTGRSLWLLQSRDTSQVDSWASIPVLCHSENPKIPFQLQIMSMIPVRVAQFSQ